MVLSSGRRASAERIAESQRIAESERIAAAERFTPAAPRVETRPVGPRSLSPLEVPQAALCSLSHPVVAVDRRGALLFVNPAAEQLLGWREAEVIGRRLHPLLHADCPDDAASDRGVSDRTASDRTASDRTASDRGASGCRLRRALRSGERLRSSFDLFAGQDGSQIAVAHAVDPMIAGGVTVGAVVSFHALAPSAREELLIEAVERVDELEAALGAVRARGCEMSDPLQALLGTLDLLVAQADAGEYLDRGRLERVRRTAERLSDLVRRIRTAAGAEIDALDVEALLHAALG